MQTQVLSPDLPRVRFFIGRAFIFFIFWLFLVFNLVEKPIEVFQSNWSFAVFGFLGAIVGNLTAVGGGIVFIPAMMFVFHLAPTVALKVALGSQAFGMSSGAVGWLRNGKTPLFLLPICVPPMLLGSFISSIVFHPNAMLVKALFGPTSIVLGVLALISQRATRHPFSEVWSSAPSLRTNVAIASFFGGVITGWVAIGEGEVVAALLMLVYGVPSEVAISLGVLLLAINSIYLTAIHQLFLGGIPWEIALFTGLGCVFGARYAASLGAKFSSRRLKLIFSLIAISDGLLFIFQYYFIRST